MSLKSSIIDRISQIKFEDKDMLSSVIDNASIVDSTFRSIIYITHDKIESAHNLKNLVEHELRNFSSEINKVLIAITNQQAEKQKVTKSHNIITRQKIDDVKKIIMIASGKGGVGKSSIAIMKAYSLMRNGYKVGVLDADIQGPSIPVIMKINEKPAMIANRFIPIEKDGIQFMSLGLMLANSTAIALRGPMLTKTIQQMLFATAWSELDYLIIDTPPGTNDIHITIAERCLVDEVIVVSTPGALALADVEKSVDFYRKFKIYISGVVENMSYYTDANEQRVNIFQSDHDENLSIKLGLTKICTIPIIPLFSDLEVIKKYVHLLH